jgi:Acetyltransferase (GNAT) domain
VTAHIVLATPRRSIRQFTEDDVGNLFELNSDPEVMRYIGRPAPREVLRDEIIPFHLEVYKRLDRLGTWAAESAGSGEFLGWFHFRPGPDGYITNIDLGCRLRRSAWNKARAPNVMPNAPAYRPIPAAARVIAARPAKGAGPIAAAPVQAEDVVAVLTSKTLRGSVGNPIANMMFLADIAQ